MQPKTFGQFLIGIFSEPEGSPSYSRFVGFLALLFVMAIYGAQYAQTGQPPDGLSLMEALIGTAVPYGVNRAGRALQKNAPAAPAKPE